MINDLHLKYKLQYPYFNLLKLLYINTFNHCLCMLMHLSCLDIVRLALSTININLLQTLQIISHRKLNAGCSSHV